MQSVPVPGDYVLGVGDEVQLRVWGSIDADLRLVVDRNGQVSIPKAGTFTLSGIKASELNNVLRAHMSRYYNNFQLTASLGQLRSLPIFVVGQARKPGAYTLSSLSTLISALFESGGPAATGSLRNIQLIRDNKTVARLDLYKFITEGNTSADQRLLPGDVILSVDGSQALRNPADLYDRLRGKPGTVKLAIERAGKVIGVDTPVRAMAPLLKSKSLDLSGMVISEPWRLDQRFSGNRGYLVVDFIMPDTPAENVEVAMSSVIVSVDGQAFSNLQDLHSYLSNKEKGSEVELVIKAQSDDSRFHNSFRVVRLSSDDLKWIDADT